MVRFTVNFRKTYTLSDDKLCLTHFKSHEDAQNGLKDLIEAFKNDGLMVSAQLTKIVNTDNDYQLVLKSKDKDDLQDAINIIYQSTDAYKVDVDVDGSAHLVAYADIPKKRTPLYVKLLLFLGLYALASMMIPVVYLLYPQITQYMVGGTIFDFYTRTLIVAGIIAVIIIIHHIVKNYLTPKNK